MTAFLYEKWNDDDIAAVRKGLCDLCAQLVEQIQSHDMFHTLEESDRTIYIAHNYLRHVQGMTAAPQTAAGGN